MATKKKPASKRAGAASNLPKGFKQIDSMAASWDVEAQPELIGIWGKVKEIEVKPTNKNDDGKRTIVNVTQDDGKTVAVWKSATLTGLFEEASEGDRVYIRYDGLGKAKKGQNAPKLFTCAIEQ
jgi:hypothetical protein